MDPINARAVMNAARVCGPRADVHDAVNWLDGAVRGEIVPGYTEGVPSNSKGEAMPDFPQRR